MHKGQSATNNFIHYTTASPRVRSDTAVQCQQLNQLRPHATHSPFTRHNIYSCSPTALLLFCPTQTSGFSAQFPPPTCPGSLEHTSSMSRPAHHWGSNVRQDSDGDSYDNAGSSSREWRTTQPWRPRHQSQPLCAWMRRRPGRRQYCHGETETSLRSGKNKSHLVQAGTRGNETTVGASPSTNILRNNDAGGPPGLGRTLTSGWQLDDRDNNEYQFSDDRETGTKRDCRHDQRVTLMNNLRWANKFVAMSTLSINRDHGVRSEHETLAMIAKAKRVSSNSIATMNSGLWPNSCKSGNLPKLCFD
jgi:hypothetical protein